MRRRPVDLPDVPVVVVSHRGPVSFRREADGTRSVRRGAGGLVTALAGLGRHLPDAVWVCAAATEEDATVAREHGGRALTVAFDPHPRVVGPSDDAEDTLQVRLVEVDPERHADFYGVVANPLLWFVQHNLFGLATAPSFTERDHDAFRKGYAAVNEQFADAVATEVEDREGRALVLVHDYHFYLVPELVRRRCPNAVITHFVHIPWPGPSAWRILPREMRGRLLTGLLGNDVVAFHTEGFARNFLLCAQEILGLPVDLAAMTVDAGDRRIEVKHYPISIDVAAFRALAATPAVEDHVRQLREDLAGSGCRLVVRVDRTDPSKNIVRGFRAFGLMLEQHPELVGQVTFLALLQPSRLDIPEYTDYLARIGAEVALVNARHARSGHRPIDLRLEDNLPLAVASYRLADVLVVNALADGMNLVAKEAVVVSERDLVLALSENTGAHQELGAFAVTLHPFDVQQQADAMYAALTMPSARRAEQCRAAARVVEENDVGKWLRAQLADVAPLLAADPSR
ncbi:MAG TPA: trehalose-6-phosphate synthase [Mycobacteriales bacterium]|nr:trehalose-6-phosphate synthase [Mycobacteriales bacterium]